jgi:hypothetical protein
MAEEFLHDLGVHAFAEEQGGAGVAKIVDPHRAG